jgi:hypothetical protein
VNGTGEGVIELVLELITMLLVLVLVLELIAMLLVLVLLTTSDEELCVASADCELLTDASVSYAATKVRLGASVQKNDTAPSCV